MGSQNPRANDPGEPWTKNAPTHLTQRLVEEFSEREPVWGWRDDSQVKNIATGIAVMFSPSFFTTGSFDNTNEAESCSS